ncbi:VTT domain-containing protein [Chloroflexota bacterium]
MDQAVNNDGQSRGERLKKKAIPVLILLLVVAITIGIYLVYGRHPERLIALEEYVYLGAFLISVIGNGTVILPGAVLLLLGNIGTVLYPTTGLVGPILVGLVGGLGAAIGEITGYMTGYSGRGMIENRRIYRHVEGRMTKKWAAMTIFIFSAVPLVFDFVGIAAGVLRFPFWKFLLLCWLGRTLLYVIAVSLAALGLEALSLYIG